MSEGRESSAGGCSEGTADSETGGGSAVFKVLEIVHLRGFFVR